MRWTRGSRSEDLEDRRDEGAFSGPIGGGLQIGLGGAVVLLLLSLATGQNLFEVFMPAGGGPVAGPSPARAPGPSQPRPHSPQEDERAEFVSFVLDDVQGVWQKEMPRLGHQYQNAKLVLFRDQVASGCGYAQSAMGPFYCPMDQKVYVDLGFYDELKTRFGASGDFAQAYVFAHEIGHHVQHMLGLDAQVRQMQERYPRQAGEYSIRLELQADCLAGVWGHSTAQRNILEQGDIEEGLNGTAAVGDDRIQKTMTGHVNPETWTHGSSKQRVEWFHKGLQSGNVKECDTFR